MRRDGMEGGRSRPDGRMRGQCECVCVCVWSVKISQVSESEVQRCTLLYGYAFGLNERQKRKFHSRAKSLIVRGINKVRSDSGNLMKSSYPIWLVKAFKIDISAIHSIVGVKRGVFICTWITFAFNLLRNSANLRTDIRGRFLILKISH